MIHHGQGSVVGENDLARFKISCLHWFCLPAGEVALEARPTRLPSHQKLATPAFVVCKDCFSEKVACLDINAMHTVYQQYTVTSAKTHVDQEQSTCGNPNQSQILGKQWHLRGS